MAEDTFNEDSLRDAIISVWGEHGAHIDVYDAILKQVVILSDKLYTAEEEIDSLRSELIMAKDEADCLYDDIGYLQERLDEC